MKTDLGRFQEMVAEAQATPEFWAEGAILEFTEALWARMEEEKVSRAELARRLGTSKAYVTKVLGGNANFTLHSLAKLAFAVGGKVRISIEPIAPKGRKPRPQKLAPLSANAPIEGGAEDGQGRRVASARAGSKNGG